MLVVVPYDIGTQTTDIHNTTDIGRSNTRESGSTLIEADTE